jgi:hypothetical protein
VADDSPYPPASVARVPKPHESRLSGVLVARVMGYLAVRVQFHGDPVAGIEVKFSKANPDGSKADPIGDPVKTDERGHAGLDRLVPSALYVCEIEHQEPALVPVVHRLDGYHPLVLPIGRPHVDVNESPEFAHE